MPQSKSLSKKGQTSLMANWDSKMTYIVEAPFIPGQLVNVLSARLKGKRGQSYTYLRHVTNNVTGSQWVDVVDSLGAVRSFKLSEVQEIKPKRKYTKKKVKS